MLLTLCKNIFILQISGGIIYRKIKEIVINTKKQKTGKYKKRK
jgi:hypothetical protein